jgi:hypothetical protein
MATLLNEYTKKLMIKRQEDYCFICGNQKHCCQGKTRNCKGAGKRGKADQKIS